MGTRTLAMKWLRAQGRSTAERVYTSKYYRADESFPGIPVWWFEFPVDVADDPTATHINLLGQVLPGSSEFHHFRVPLEHLRAQRDRLGFREVEQRFSLYLSAEPHQMFREVRGGGGVDFGVYRVM